MALKHGTPITDQNWQFLGSKSGAELLAQSIRDYWADRSYLVEAKVEVSGAPRTPRWDVRSNLVNGLPRDIRK
jgi:hypothetical protein